MTTDERKKKIWQELCEAAEMGDLSPQRPDEVTIKDLMALLGVPEWTARKIAEKLEEKGLVDVRKPSNVNLYTLSQEAHRLLEERDLF